MQFYFSQSHIEGMVMGRNYDARMKAEPKTAGENAFPDVWGLINCLVMDSDCLEYPFAEWAENLGYDPDSISAKKIYDTSQEQTFKAKALMDIEQMRQYLEENGLN